MTRKLCHELFLGCENDEANGEGNNMTIGNKIIVIGSPGSGKSTLAIELAAKTGLPLIHLDNVWWRPDRTHITRAEFDERLGEILQGEKWIVEGNYSRTIDLRFAACDTVIFLEGIKNRVGKSRPDIPWVELELDPELVKLVRNYKTENRPRVYELIENYPEKQIIVFKTREEAAAWLNQIERKQ